MTTTKSDPLDQVFMALADGTRREIVQMLSKGEKTMSQLSEPFAMSMAAVSKHVKVLEKSGLLKRRIEGRTHYLMLVPEQLTGALDWISVYRYFWSQRLDELDKLISED
ncbi:MAG: metalloregulator ArsR/SmtB family transcription factor [Bermanella sp.]